MRQSLIWLFIFLGAAVGQAQKYRMESITVADGLSQGFVSSLLQDSRGFIWLGTLDGLNRYDGYQIKRFTTNNTNPWGLKANSIYCMAEDRQGLLWLGTEKGLVVMDPYSERFVQLADINRDFPSSPLADITIEKDGQIWLSCQLAVKNGVYVVRAPEDLIRKIREGRVQPADFTLRYVLFGEQQMSPTLRWIPTGRDTAVIGIDIAHRFFEINSTTLHPQRIDPHRLDYHRLGDYGLIKTSQKALNIVFPLHAATDGQHDITCYETGFLPLPDGMPLLFRGGDCILYQADTAAFLRSKIAGTGREDQPFYRQFKTFLRTDKPLSHTAMADRAGNLWMGTTGYGVRKISRNKLDFKSYLFASGTYNAASLPDGRVWLGHRRPEFVLNLQTGQLEAPPWVTELPKDTKAQSLLISRSGDWWMVLQREDHLALFHKERGSRQWKDMAVDLPFSFDPALLFEDCRDNIWLVGLQGRIIRIRPDKRLERWQIKDLFPAQPGNELRGTCIVEGEGGQLWIGCNYGLVRVDHPEGEPAFQLCKPSRQEGPLESNWILSLYPEPHSGGLIWIGTRGGGLSRYNSQTSAYETFTESDGLVNNVVYGILADSFGYLWLSTNRGLSRFNLRNHTFSNFLGISPELNTEFNTGAYIHTPSGELAFGSVDGLYLIRPHQEPQSEPPCVVELTQLKINGIAIDPAQANAFLQYRDKNEISLQLPFSQNNLILEFTALQTNDPSSAQYRYRVLGLGEEWTTNGHQHTVNLVAIPPGNYTIELQSIGTNGSWDQAPITRLDVTIRPPWFLSWPAWLLYGGLVAWLLYIYVSYERRQLGLKYAGEISRKEVERLQSLDDFKNRFFGYISHEFKTPLTIIMGQAKRLPAEQEQRKTAIFQQGQSMLEMVDQMVDITRLDNQELQLNWRNGNLSDYVRYLVESLRPLTEFKNIELGFHTSVPGLMMDFDPLRLKYIFNNLITNAVRHTPPGGQIDVSLSAEEENQVRLEVVDTGEGVAPQDLPNIFERYYQGDSANPQPHHFGLGLAFVKDLLQLFAGSIEVHSRLGHGTRFTVRLPVSRSALPLEQFSLIHSHHSDRLREENMDPSAETRLPLLLIVEDNPFISDFLWSCLKPYFLLEFTADGLAGYKKALEIIPDVILTDVMMPHMDGYELTRQLKHHELTAHIPIVLLSARSGLSDRLTGHQLGADAYLGKPFDEQELILVLQNLYRLQQRWRERYAGLTDQTGLVQELVTLPQQQREETIRQTDAFMLKIYAFFEKDYRNEDYDLLQLCHDMETSPSQLRRKLIALSDQSPMQLLRRYRLQKAYDLLVNDPNSNVKEICFQVGFKDPSHFSRLFSKTFGLAPSEVRKVNLGN